MHSAERMHRLDVLRFVAAILVLASHYTFGFAEIGVNIPPFFARLGEVGRYGFLGVHVFFVVSGFVIIASAARVDAAAFFSGRFARIFPTFAVCALISLVAVSYTGRMAPSLSLYAANLTFEPHVFGLTYIDGSYWTLRYEVQFYGFVLLILLFNSWDRLLMPCLIVWLGISAVCTAGYLPKPLRWLFIADYAPLFMMGIGLFLWRGSRSWASAILTATATLLAVLNEFQHIRDAANASQAQLNPWLTGAAVAGILPLMLFVIKPTRGSNNVSYFLGGISYPIYLLHQEAGIAVLQFIKPVFGDFSLAITTAAIITASSVVFLVDDACRSNIRRRVDKATRYILQLLQRFRSVPTFPR